MSKTSNIVYGNYAVAFIDILGQKEDFKELEGVELVSSDEDVKQKLIKLHKKTTGFVEKLRGAFTDFFKAATEETKPSNQIPVEKQKIYQEMRKTRLQFKYFSDCMQGFVCLRTDKYHSVAINGVHSLLLGCGGMLILSLAVGKVFRAGIDVGIGIEIEDDEVYGPALFRAFELESQIAQYPRIVIGDNLINYLKNLSDRVSQMPNQIPEDIEWSRRLADDCISMIKIDVDGYPFLDILGGTHLKSGRDAFGSEFDKLLEKAFIFVQNEYRKWKAEKTQYYHKDIIYFISIF